MDEIIYVFIFLGWVALLLKSSTGSIGFPKHKNPPPPPKTKCICNNISNHSPGGRCEACYSKITKPRILITKDVPALFFNQNNKNKNRLG